MIFLLCLVEVLLLAVAKDDKGGWEESVNDEGKRVQTLKIEAPSMTEEDQYGYNMPDRYKCDSCRAVVHHLHEALNKQQPKSRRLKSWEYTDLFEETCRSAFEGYGIKLVNGENVLSGPGLKDNVELQPGMGAIQMGGENWKKRLAEECRKLVFEQVGEEDFYDFLYGKWKDGEQIDIRDYCTKEAHYCKAAKLGPEPPKEEKKPKKERGKAERKPKEKKEKPKPAADKASDKLTLEDFMQKLASKNGVKQEEYVAPRSEREWEKLLVSVAGRIFNRQSEEL